MFMNQREKKKVAVSAGIIKFNGAENCFQK